MRPAIELRSDTVTRPSPAMRAAMAAAEVGDDVFGEDPSVLALEALAAWRTGKEAALYVPSGSMANLIAQIAWVRRGDEVIVGQDSHIVRYEVGSGAAVAGVQYNVVPGNGLMSAAEVEERIAHPTFHTPGTGLVWLENTHNSGGGAVYPLAALAEIRDLCRSRGIPLHMDGARVFNAAVALGVEVAEIAAHVDSLSFCLSKGLGAPVGSVLCASAEFREQARRLRKMLGGGMRQAGILAAAGIYALEHNLARLAEDHANARRLARRLGACPGLEVRPEEVATNIVIARLPGGDAETLVSACRERAVLFLTRDARRVRFVTHLDVSAEQVDEAAEIVAEVLQHLTIRGARS